MNAVTPFPQTSPLEQAAARILRAKAAEMAANAERVSAERDLVAILGDSLPAEGTHHTESGMYKVTVKTGINRRTDRKALEAISDRVPEAFKQRLIRWKPEVDLRELRFIQNNEPELAAVIAEAITESPAKPSVTVSFDGGAV